MRDKIFFMLLSLMFLLNLFVNNEADAQVLEINENLDQIFNSEEWGRFFIIKDIFNNDVFELFDETKQYNTDLKKSVFLKTQEYKDYKKKLEVLALEVKNHMFTKKLDPWHDMSLSDYNIKKGGFFLESHNATSLLCNYEKEIQDVCFDMLPIKDNKLFIPCPEDKALVIENIKNKTIKIKFNVTGIIKKKMICRDLSSGESYPTTDEILNSTNVTFYIIDESTGEELFSKNFVSKK